MLATATTDGMDELWSRPAVPEPHFQHQKVAGVPLKPKAADEQFKRPLMPFVQGLRVFNCERKFNRFWFS